MRKENLDLMSFSPSSHASNICMYDAITEICSDVTAQKRFDENHLFLQEPFEYFYNCVLLYILKEFLQLNALIILIIVSKMYLR